MSSISRDLQQTSIPKHRGAEGTVNIPGMEIVGYRFKWVEDLSVNTLAANLLFRYPVWSPPDLSQGRIAPYVGIGDGAQRAVMSLQIFPYREVSYAPAGQVLVGMKFYVMKNLAVFGEYKRIWSSHDFHDPALFSPGYEGKWSLATNVLAGGVSLHFLGSDKKVFSLGRILPAGFLFLFFKRLAVDTEGGNWAGFQARIGTLLFAAFADAIDVLVHAS